MRSLTAGSSTHSASHVVVQRAAYLELPPLPQPAGQYVDEAGAAVGLRGDGELVVGRTRFQPAAMAAAASTAVRLSP